MVDCGVHRTSVFASRGPYFVNCSVVGQYRTWGGDFLPYSCAERLVGTLSCSYLLLHPRSVSYPPSSRAATTLNPSEPPPPSRGTTRENHLAPVSGGKKRLRSRRVVVLSTLIPCPLPPAANLAAKPLAGDHRGPHRELGEQTYKSLSELLQTSTLVPCLENSGKLCRRRPSRATIQA